MSSFNKVYARPPQWSYHSFNSESVRYTNIPLWEPKPLDRSPKDPGVGADDDGNEPEDAPADAPAEVDADAGAGESAGKSLHLVTTRVPSTNQFTTVEPADDEGEKDIPDAWDEEAPPPAADEPAEAAPDDANVEEGAAEAEADAAADNFPDAGANGDGSAEETATVRAISQADK